MSVALRARLDFLFNNGRGVRVDQLDGAIVESVSEFDGGIAVAYRDSENVARSLVIEQTPGISASRPGYAVERVLAAPHFGLAGDYRFRDLATEGGAVYALATAGEGENAVGVISNSGEFSAITLPATGANQVGGTASALAVRGDFLVIAWTQGDQWTVATHNIATGALVSSATNFSSHAVRVLAAAATTNHILEVREDGDGFALRAPVINLTSGAITWGAAPVTLEGLSNPVSATLRGGNHLLILEADGRALGYSTTGFGRLAADDETYAGEGFTGLAEHEADYVSTGLQVFQFVERAPDRFTDLPDTPGALTPSQYLRANAAGDALEFTALAVGAHGVEAVSKIPAAEAGAILYLTHAVYQVSQTPHNATLTPAAGTDGLFGYSAGHGFAAAGAIAYAGAGRLPLEFIGVTSSSQDIDGYAVEFVGFGNRDFAGHYPTVVINGTDYALSGEYYDRGAYVSSLVNPPQNLSGPVTLNFKDAAGNYVLSTETASTHEAGLWRWTGAVYELIPGQRVMTVAELLDPDNSAPGTVDGGTFRQAVSGAVDPNFAGLAVGRRGLRASLVEQWFRHFTGWTGGPIEGGALTAVNMDSERRVLARISGAGLYRGSQLVRADEARGAENIAEQGGYHFTLTADGALQVPEGTTYRTIWHGATALTLTNHGAAYSIAPYFGGETPPPQFIGLDVTATEIHAVAMQEASSAAPSFEVVTLQYSHINARAYEGLNALASVSFAATADQVWDGTTVPGDDVTVAVTGGGEELVINGFDLSFPAVTVEHDTLTPNVIVNFNVVARTGTSDVVFNADGDLGSFTGDNILAAAGETGGLATVAHIEFDETNRLLIRRNTAHVAPSSFSTWHNALLTLDDDYSLFFIDAAGVVDEFSLTDSQGDTLAGLESVGKNQIRWNSSDSPAGNIQGSEARFSVVIAQTGSRMVRNQAATLTRSTVSGHGYTFTAAVAAGELDGKSFYFHDGDRETSEYPFAEGMVTAGSVTWHTPVSAGDTAPALEPPPAGEVAQLSIADAGGVNPVAISGLLISNTTYADSGAGDLGYGAARSASVQADNLAVWFARGQIANWDLSANRAGLTRGNGARDWDANISPPPGHSSLHSSETDTLIHAGDFARLYSAPAAGQSAPPSESVAAIGGNTLVSVTLYTQVDDIDREGYGPPVARWRWENGWSADLSPWSLDIASAKAHWASSPFGSATDPIFAATLTTRRVYDEDADSYTYIDFPVSVHAIAAVQYSPTGGAPVRASPADALPSDYYRFLHEDGTWGPWLPGGPADWLQILSTTNTYGGPNVTSRHLTFNAPIDLSAVHEIMVTVEPYGGWNDEGDKIGYMPVFQEVLEPGHDGTWQLTLSAPAAIESPSVNTRNMVYDHHNGVAIGLLDEPQITSAGGQAYTFDLQDESYEFRDAAGELIVTSPAVFGLQMDFRQRVNDLADSQMFEGVTFKGFSGNTNRSTIRIWIR